jgi:hypothetical protein
MGNGDLSTDLGWGILMPASSVRPVEGHSPHADAEAKARRRSHPEKKDHDGEEASDADDTPAHQLDHLA